MRVAGRKDGENSVAAGLFGVEQALIGGVEEFFGFETVRREVGNSGAEGDVKGLVFFAFEGDAGEFVGDALERKACGVGVFIDKDDGKFFAAPAGAEVFDAESIGEQASERGKYAVAGEVAVGVVDLFEAVEIEQAKGKGACVA